MTKLVPTVVFGREPLKGREEEFLSMIVYLHEMVLLAPYVANGYEITAEMRRKVAEDNAKIMAHHFPGVTFSVQMEEIPERPDAPE